MDGLIKTYSFAGLMTRRTPDGKSDLIVLHGIRESHLGQAETVRRYIAQAQADNPGYTFATTISCLEVDSELVDDGVY
jgi:hypothetical protein